jgi:hypothetical protein
MVLRCPSVMVQALYSNASVLFQSMNVPAIYPEWFALPKGVFLTEIFRTQLLRVTISSAPSVVNANVKGTHSGTV